MHHKHVEITSPLLHWRSIDTGVRGLGRLRIAHTHISHRSFDEIRESDIVRAHCLDAMCLSYLDLCVQRLERSQ